LRQYTQGNPQIGHCFAEASCARCHALGRTGDRPLPIKPFRIMDCASLGFAITLLKWVRLAVDKSSAQ